MRKFLLIFFLSVTSQQALATPTADTLQAMAYAGDIAGVEAAYAAIHAEERAGDLSFDELRSLYLALIVYDPRVLEFTQSWLDAFPNSPHAHAIRAWQLYNASFEIRGEKGRRDTYYLALEGFDHLQEQTLDHAWTAYQAAPDLVPASDALLALQTTYTFLDPMDFVQLVGDIMTVTPNSHSLYLATDTAKPQWGGIGSSAVRALCDTFAAAVTDVTDYDADTCFVAVIFDSDTYLRDTAAVAEANRLLNGSDHPYLDEARLFQGFAALEDTIPAGSDVPQTYHRNLEFAATLAAILSRPGVHDTHAAADYDNFYAVPLGLPLILPEMIAREQAWAQDRLTVDPYDPMAITALTATHWDSFGAPMPDLLSVSDRIALLKRQLMVNPYLSETWSTLALLVQSQELSPFSSLSDPYYENAIVYSNYDVLPIQYYLQAKFEQINRRLRAEQFELSGRFMDQALFEDGFCPYLRLENLKQFLCNGPRSGNMDCGGWGPSPEHVLAVAMERATDANLCIAERRADPADLAFAPTTIDLTD